jgi:hypothetical protein
LFPAVDRELIWSFLPRVVGAMQGFIHPRRPQPSITKTVIKAKNKEKKRSVATLIPAARRSREDLE